MRKLEQLFEKIGATCGQPYGGQLSSLSCRQLVDHDQVACLCLGDIISEGQSSLAVAETKVCG